MNKNNSVILDSSALICLISKEIGFEKVAEIIPYAIMSSISIAEVARFLIERKNMSLDNAQRMILSIIDNIIPFDAALAFTSASILAQTRKFGLSLGDRACIVLGLQTGFPVYTADKIWAELGLDCQIVLIR